MKNQFGENDYVLYDKANDRVLRFEHSGEIVIFGTYEEAAEDCRGNEEVVKCSDLPQVWQDIVLDQLGYSTRESALEYVNKRKSDWGDNLIGWVEEREGKWFPCFNVWD